MFPQGPRPPQPVEKLRKPAVQFQPATAEGLRKGIDLILNTVAPTLGPLPRTVAIEQIANHNSLPEILDSGGTIARRIIQVKPRKDDVGAMFARNVIWTQHENAGDGCATTAVIFRSLVDEGLRYIANGGDAMMLRRELDALLPGVLARIEAQRQPLRGRKALVDMALTISHHAQLSRYLGEIFDIIGEYGRLEVRKGRSRELEREYVEGLWWDKGVISREMLYDKAQMRTDFENGSILITDFQIDEPGDLVPVLNLCVSNGIQSLLLICKSLSDRALGLLFLKSNLEKIRVMAISNPGFGLADQKSALEDMAVLSGARVLLKDAGNSLEKVTLSDLGKARRIWGKVENFGFSAGGGDPRALRSHIATLRGAYEHAKGEDKTLILRRISRLLGGSATLWAGANTPLEVDALKDLAERSAEALRGAMREGTVPGGGAALLACREELKTVSQSAPGTEKAAAARMLSRALEEPFRVILQNAGYLPEEFLPQLRQAPAGWGVDVRSGELCDMRGAGIIDSAAVVKSAVRAAVSSAALVLTLDIVVFRKKPPEVVASTE